MTRASTLRRAGALTAALATLLAGSSFYAASLRADAARNPSDSIGSITLAVPAPHAKAPAGESTAPRVQQRPAVKTAIAWTSPWVNARKAS